ncbi:acyltransferase [Leptospira sp. FAT2]|uniref:acyltransferase n=1 Tax=Leptospira sanjuanensis TaxID=2879643 RepID=UPI001EE8A2EA|nr:acyltransferase [Leptospira sanjuanensis]MCG6167595.1 acyltransferase [Leptospira sanjuanensis]MCG6193014.1 acyltransferase [Leptospira sanjuanensis]
MSVFQKFFGNIPISTESQGIKIFGAFFKRLLHCIARYFPLLPSFRVILHRWRGVKIGKNVFIGVEVFIDDAIPSAVEIEDDVVIIAQNTILGHAYYPFHFSSILKSKDTLESGKTIIKKGAYIGIRSTILAGVTLGEYSIVGAGSLVTKDVPAYTMVVGVPAKVVAKFKKSDLVFKEL